MAVIHHRFLRSPLSAAVIAALSVSPLYAQENTPLGTVTVTAQQAATKVETPFIETPQSVSTITREQMDNRGVSTVQRATDYTPGVYSNQHLLRWLENHGGCQLP